MREYESEECLAITRAEKIKYCANFTDVLDGATIASVATPTQTVGAGLVIGTPAINTGGAITVDGKSIAASKAVQFTIDARSVAADAVGSAKVRVVVTLSTGEIVSLDCRLTVVA